MTRPGKTHKDQRKHRMKVGTNDPHGKGLEEHIKRELRRGVDRKHTTTTIRKSEGKRPSIPERDYEIGMDCV